jgi:hypothetical protein
LGHGVWPLGGLSTQDSAWGRGQDAVF